MRYLYNQRAADEVKSILKMSLDLCHSMVVLDFHKQGYYGLEKKIDNPDDLLTALAHLSHEAEENELEDIHMVLEACTKLCLATQYCCFRGCLEHLY